MAVPRSTSFKPGALVSRPSSLVSRPSSLVPRLPSLVSRPSSPVPCLPSLVSRPSSPVPGCRLDVRTEKKRKVLLMEFLQFWDYFDSQDDAECFIARLKILGREIVSSRPADLASDDQSWGWCVSWLEPLEGGDSDVW